MKYIYSFTNKINGKIYIGSTINPPEQRYRQHIYYASHLEQEKSKYPLYCAIRKYGLENFNFEIIKEVDCSEEELRNLEHNLIISYNTISPNGYNQTENTLHSFQDSNVYKKVSETKRELAKRVAMINPKTLECLGIYRSIKDCSEITGIDERKIGSCCRGERLTTSNKIFYWLDDNDEYIIPTYERDRYKGETNNTQKQITNRKVAKIDMQTSNILETYDSIALAARINECDASAISKVCQGKRNKVKGYFWKYIN